MRGQKFAVLFFAFMLMSPLMFMGPAPYGVSSEATPITIPAQITTGAETILIGDGEEKKAESSDAGLTRRQRRKLGLTFRNIRKVAKELNAAGELSPDRTVASAQVLAVLTEENPRAFEEEAAAIDWDSLLDFIERLMSIIMKFFI